MADKRIVEGILFKKSGKNALNSKTEKVNTTAKILLNNNIMQTNALIREAGV